MHKELITFRCPDALLEELQGLAKSHGMSVSELIVFSLQLLVRKMADQGMLPALRPVPLPPPAQMPDIHWCRRAGR